MIKVVVKNLQGQVTHGAQFKTQAEIDAWKAQNEALKAFGKPERWVFEDMLSFEGEDPTKAIATEQVGGPDEEKTRYKFAAEYTFEQSDITAEIAAQKAIEYRLAKQDFGALLLAKITNLNSAKQLTQQQLNELLTDPTAMVIERLLWTGSLDFAKTAILGYQGTLYSSQEKQAFAAEIDSWLAANTGA